MKNITKKSTLNTIQENLGEIKSQIEPELLQFIEDNFTGENKIRVIKKAFFENILIKDLKCIVCDKPVKIGKSNKFAKTCGSPRCLSEVYATMRGKKRPDHAKKMSKIIKEKIKNGEFLNKEHKAKLRKKLNSVATNKKELLNRGLPKEEIEKMSEIEIKNKIKDIRRQIKISHERKEKELGSFLSDKKYIESVFFDIEYFNSLKTFDDKIKYKNSIISRVSKVAHPNMGGKGFGGTKWKKEIKKDLKYNVFSDIVEVKSSYESYFIDLLEENKVLYGYEASHIIIYYNNAYRRYYPDFFIYDTHHKLQKVVELKGYIQDMNEMIEKTLAAVKYYEKMGVDYYFIRKPLQMTYDEIEICKCSGKTKNEIIKIIKGEIYDNN